MLVLKKKKKKLKGNFQVQQTPVDSDHIFSGSWITTDQAVSAAQAEGKAPHIYSLNTFCIICTQTFKPCRNWAFMEQEGGGGRRTPESQFSHWNLKFSHQIHKHTFCHFGEKKKDKRKIPSNPLCSSTASSVTCVLNSKGWMEKAFFPPWKLSYQYLNIFQYLYCRDNMKTKSLLHLASTFQKHQL